MTEFAYDIVPYASLPFPQTHPDRLATIATLLGMTPPPVDRCRVFELGCAAGGNLIPMAYQLPQSQFVGLDLSSREIETGQATIAALNLENVTLRQLNILDIDPELGQFDYIIAHGVYSWVPQPVQEKILEVCRQHLAPQGVAYLSYNVYPGWRMHQAVREMMLFHTRHIEDPQEKAAQARGLLDFLDEGLLVDQSAYARVMHQYVAHVRSNLLPRLEDHYLYHNELSEINEPCYFHEFAARAAGHDLRYLAEAQFHTMLVANLPPKVAASLREVAKDTITLEQYLDFLRNRTFRQTLLCHQEVSLKGRLAPERLVDFSMASAALPERAKIDVNDTSVETFRAPNGDSLTTDHPLTKAAMVHLAQVWPQAVPFTALTEAACTRLNGSTPADLTREGQILGANLLQAFGHNEDLIELHIYPPRFARQAGDRPVVSALARHQAKTSPHVTNLRHEAIKLEGLGYRLIPYLDGSWSRNALLELTQEWIADGSLEFEQGNRSFEEPIDIQEMLPQLLEASLRGLANAALLER